MILKLKTNLINKLLKSDIQSCVGKMLNVLYLENNKIS